VETTIDNPADARAYLLTLDGAEGAEAVQAALNCRFAEIDDAGEVWIEDPQTGHWLDDDALVSLAQTIERGV